MQIRFLVRNIAMPWICSDCFVCFDSHRDPCQVVKGGSLTWHQGDRGPEFVRRQAAARRQKLPDRVILVRCLFSIWPGKELLLRAFVLFSVSQMCHALRTWTIGREACLHLDALSNLS